MSMDAHPSDEYTSCSKITLTPPQRPLITLNQKTGIKTAKIDESRFQVQADSGSQSTGVSGFKAGCAWANIAFRTAGALVFMS
jgi:hypothetical protein